MKAASTLLIVAGALVAQSVSAEPPIGSRLGERTRTVNQRIGYDALRTAHRTAECLYFKRGSDVRAFLAARNDADLQRYGRALSKSVECARAQLTDTPSIEGAAVMAPADVMRGMYAEAALLKMKTDDALQPLPAQPSYARDWFAVTGRPAAIDEMGACTADQNPAGIHALLSTAPESAEEIAATKALGATLGPCLPQGATLKANRQSLRAVLAEALYQRAVAPPPADIQG
ncbi:MAG: hypothetical protein ACOY5R_00860 [Pseudomonadota bacterium]